MSDDLFSRNGLLSSVEQPARADFDARVQLVQLQLGQTLYSLGNRVTHVYFPLGGLIGILSETPDGEMIDSALVGLEGAIGVFEACGSRQFFAEAMVQVPGPAVQMTAAAYRQLFEVSAGIRNAVHRYVEQLMSETRQSVACNAIHDVEARLCRTILEALDKSRFEDNLPLTQLTMARMLGAQRSTVAEILSRLERDGVITKRRGALVIDNRAALESRCCGCRIAVRIAREAIWSEGEPACETVLAAE